MRSGGGAPAGGPSCVAWPDPENLMAAHRTGQSVADVFSGMPLYCPADGGGNCSRSESATSASSSSSEEDEGARGSGAAAAPRAGGGGAAGFVSFSGTHGRVTGSAHTATWVESWDERTFAAMTSSDFDDLGAGAESGSSGSEDVVLSSARVVSDSSGPIYGLRTADGMAPSAGSNGSDAQPSQVEGGAQPSSQEPSASSAAAAQSIDRNGAAAVRQRSGGAAEAGPS